MTVGCKTLNNAIFPSKSQLVDNASSIPRIFALTIVYRDVETCMCVHYRVCVCVCVHVCVLACALYPYRNKIKKTEHLMCSLDLIILCGFTETEWRKKRMSHVQVVPNHSVWLCRNRMKKKQNVSCAGCMWSFCVVFWRIVSSLTSSQTSLCVHWTCSPAWCSLTPFCHFSALRQASWCP